MSARNSSQSKVQEIYLRATAEYSKIINKKYYYLSPTSLSSILRCIHLAKDGLDTIFQLTERTLEGSAWLILNFCKFILEASEPLIYLGCSKYVVEYLTFAATCIDSVVNLSTTRHLALNTKLYTTAIAALLTQESFDEANALLFHFHNNVKDMRKREEIDPPVPDHIEKSLVQAEIDIAVMKCVYIFFKDPEVKLINNPQNYGGPPLPSFSGGIKMQGNSTTFIELCFQEIVRLHEISSSGSAEARIKRTTCLLKSFTKYLEPLPAPAAPVPVATTGKGAKAKPDKTHVDTTAEVNTPVTFTNQVLADIIALAMFEKVDSQFSVNDLLLRLWPKVSQNDAEALANSSSSFSKESCHGELELLKRLHMYLSAKDNNSHQTLVDTVEFLTRITNFIHDETALRRRSLLRRISLQMWSCSVYPALQQLLSADDGGTELTESESQLIIPPLQTIFHTMDAAGTDDIIFLCTVALATANLFLLIKDRRSAISILHRALDLVDEFRATRVDIHLHVPSEIEDVRALQHASFSTKVSADDWFYSRNRLGAHMFAGYSIFGAGSSADRMDQAVAEIQTDLMILYFRTEIEYGKEQMLLKMKHRRKLELKEQRRVAAAVTTGPSSSVVSKASSSSSGARSPTLQKGTSGILSSISANDIVVEKLPCVTCLKAYCCKSSYARSLLLLEMVRAETSEERKSAHMKAAKDSLAEATERERLLRNSFSDISLKSEDTVRHPVVLSRSHNCIYVAPVMCANKHRKVQYFRILAREEGSGIGLTLGSNGLPGCEVKVHVTDMDAPNKSVVAVTNLRRGDRYLFASVAYSADNTVVGDISPQTPIVIDAVNPLPITLLWIHFTQVAKDMNFSESVSYGSSKIMSEFFQDPSVPPPRVVGKGVNIFFTQEPSLYMLTVQQSSEMLLAGVIRSFLYAEVPSNPVHVYDGPVHYFMRKSKQIDTILRLRKTAVIMNIACQIDNYELIVRCASLGYELASDLLKRDEIHLASYLLQPLVIFAAALQTIPLKHWEDTEHNLYSPLIYHICRCATISNGTGTAQAVLTSFHTYLPKDIPATPIFSEKLQAVYHSLIPSLRLVNNIMSSPPLESQIPCILGVNHDIKSKLNIWALSCPQRLKLLKGVGLSLSGVPGAPIAPPHILEALKDEAPLPSAQLEVLVFLIKEVVDAGYASNASKVLHASSVYEESLSAPVRQACRDWGLAFVLKGSRPVVAIPTNPKDSKDSKPGKTAKDTKGSKHALVRPQTPPDAVEPPAPVIFTEEETRKQLFQLASLTSILASASFDGHNRRNYYPKEATGPMSSFDPKTLREELARDPLVHEDPLNGTQADSDSQTHQPIQVQSGSPVKASHASASVPPPVVPSLQLKSNDFITYCMACLSLFLRSESPAAAVNTVTSLWTHIIDEWYTPRTFAAKFHSIHRHLIVGLESYLNLLEIFQDVYAIIVADATNDSTKNRDLTSRFPCTAMEIREYLYLSKEILPFLVQSLWCLNHNKAVVDFGTRIVRIYISVTPEFSKNISEVCLPLMIDSQEQIVDEAERVVASRDDEVQAFINDWEEAQRKIRRKKLRIARIEKSDEELKFEADKAALEEASARGRASLQSCRDCIESIRVLEREFGNIWSTGLQMLGRIRVDVKELLATCAAQTPIAGTSGGLSGQTDYTRCLELQAVSEKLADVMDMFGQLAKLLRDRREYDVLLETLTDQGDLLLLFGRQREARSVWNDAIDGLFSVMDAASQWKIVTKEALRKLDGHIIRGAIPLVIILGKLSKFCCMRDWDMKSQYCRMAAEICKIPFLESIGHPLTTYGFAAYICRELGGLSPLTMSEEKMTAYSFQVSVEEIITVLLAEKYCVEALPLVVLLEYFHTVYTLRSDEWLRARILRIRLLVDSSLFAEAASMLAGISEFMAGIEERVHPKITNTPASFISKFKMTTDFDAVASGLVFHQAIPYHNHLPPHDDKNKQAIDWIKTYPKAFKEFAAHYTIPAPGSDKPQSAEPVPSAFDAKKPAGKDKSVPAAGKGKRSSLDTSAAGSSQGELSVKLIPKFSAVLEYLVVEACALFLIYISETNTRVMSPYHGYLTTLSVAADEILTAVVTALEGNVSHSSGLGDDVAQLAASFGLLQRCQLLKCRASPVIHDNNVKHELAALETFSNYLRAIPKPLPANVFYDVAQVWFEARERVVMASMRAGRSHIVLSLCSQLIDEAIVFCGGYWVRRFLLHRALAHYKLGIMEECLNDCDTLIMNYDLVLTYDLGLVRTLALKASLIRQSALKHHGLDCITALQSSIKQLQRARDVVRDIAHSHGFLGVNANVTFSEETSMILRHHARPPLLHHLSTEQDNYPPLSLPIPPCKNFGSSEGGSLGEAAISNNFKYISASISEFRLGPVDNEDDYVKGEYCNIYLKSVRYLSNCYQALCVVLDDLRRAEINEIVVASPVSDNGDENINLDSNTVYAADDILLEEHTCCEEGLKAMRHVLYGPSFTRVSLLTFAGKTRTAKTLSGAKADEAISPLLKALDIAVNGVHPWESMFLLCLELLEIYGNGNLQLSGNESRLHLAIFYLQLAVKVNIQLDMIRASSLVLCGLDKALAGPCAAELGALMSGHVGIESARPNLPGTSKSAGSATDGAGPTGRDALFLLSSLMRESDVLWLDGFEYDTRADFHLALKKNSATYASTCCLAPSTLPSTKTGPPQVPPNSLCSLWTPAPTRRGKDHVGRGEGEERATGAGLFDCLTGYFLCGIPVAVVEDAKAHKQNKDVSTVPTGDALLKKVTVHRNDLLDVNHTTSRLVDTLSSSTGKINSDRMKVIGAELANILQKIHMILSTSSSEQDKGEGKSNLHIDIIDEKGVQVLKLKLLAASSSTPESSSCSLAINLLTVTHLMELFSPHKACENVIDNTLCSFLRMILVTL